MARRILDGLVYEKKHFLPRPPKYKVPDKKESTPFVEDGDVIEDLSSGKKLKVQFRGKEMTFIPMS